MKNFLKSEKMKVIYKYWWVWPAFSAFLLSLFPYINPGVIFPIGIYWLNCLSLLTKRRFPRPYNQEKWTFSQKEIGLGFMFPILFAFFSTFFCFFSTIFEPIAPLETYSPPWNSPFLFFIYAIVVALLEFIVFISYRGHNLLVLDKCMKNEILAHQEIEKKKNKRIII